MSRRIHLNIHRQTTGAATTGVKAVGARAIGSSATGAIAIAAAAVGALAIGRVTIANAVVRKRRAGEVEIRSLKVQELAVGGRRWPADEAAG